MVSAALVLGSVLRAWADVEGVGLMYQNYTGADDDKQAKVTHAFELFEQVRMRRSNFEVMWEESAGIVLPEHRGTFSFGSTRPPGLKLTEFQLDSKAAINNHKFMALADALMTPFATVWSHYCADDPYLMKDRTVAEYYERVTQIVWAERYRAEANFVEAQQCGWLSLGGFGNMSTIVDELDTAPGEFRPGLRYIPCSVGEIYLLVNHQGRVDGYIRWFRWNGRQAMQRWGAECPEAIKRACARNSLEPFDFIQVVMPRSDYDIGSILTNKSKRYSSCYISMTGRCIVEEGGYRTFPLPTGRYMVAPGEDYGRGPMQQVLASSKTKNAEKGTFLVQGHRAGNPVVLLPGDDSLFDFKNAPGSFSYGLVNEDGRPMAHVLPAGNIQITHEMMQEEDRFCDDAFLVSMYAELFDVARRGGQMNMAQVMQMLSDRAMFLAPTLGKQFSYLSTLAHRELDILSYQRKLPPIPPALKEAKGQFGTAVRYASPLALALKAPATLGFMRTVAMANESVQAGGDPAIMDIFDFEVAFPEIAQDNFAPTRWMSTEQKMAQKRKGRAAAQAEANRVKSLPGEAAIMKAKAISDKAGAGMNIGGVLSGTPEGGMPMMPGQSAPGGRPF